MVNHSILVTSLSFDFQRIYMLISICHGWEIKSMIGYILMYEVRIPAYVKIYILNILYVYLKRIITTEFIMFIILPFEKNEPNLNNNA